MSKFNSYFLMSEAEIIEYTKDKLSLFAEGDELLAGAQDIANAFNIAEEIEFSAEIYYWAKNIGEPIILAEEEMMVMHEKFKTYGQR